MFGSKLNEIFCSKKKSFGLIKKKKCFHLRKPMKKCGIQIVARVDVVKRKIAPREHISIQTLAHVKRYASQALKQKMLSPNNLCSLYLMIFDCNELPGKVYIFLFCCFMIFTPHIIMIFLWLFFMFSPLDYLL